MSAQTPRGRTKVYLDTDEEKVDEAVLEDAKGPPELPGVRLSIGWDASRDNQIRAVFAW